jgi:hypothetical protein
MHPIRHISVSIRQMGSSDNFTTDNSEWIHITNVKETYRSSNKVNYICQILKHNGQCNSLAYMVGTQSHLALEGLYNDDCPNDFNLLSATDRL